MIINDESGRMLLDETRNVFSDRDVDPDEHWKFVAIAKGFLAAARAEVRAGINETTVCNGLLTAYVNASLQSFGTEETIRVLRRTADVL